MLIQGCSCGPHGRALSMTHKSAQALRECTLNHKPIRRLPYKTQKPYIPLTPESRSENVTIAVGALTPKGIVLCSDSQITGTGYKYPDKKVFSIDACGKTSWSLGLTYSGDPQKMTRIYEQMNDHLTQPDIDVDAEYVRACFEAALSNARNAIITHSDPDIDVLCGFIPDKGKPILFTGKNGIVSETAKWTVLGVGDASITRYLQKILPINRGLQDNMTALVICAYVIKQASDYIDGCGGDLQFCMLRHGIAPKSSRGTMPTLKYTSTLLDSLIKKSILFSFWFGTT